MNMKILPVTYFSQRDNEISPVYSCFPTSMAMMIDYLLQVKGKDHINIGCPEGEQLEDYLNKRLNSAQMKTWMVKNKLGNLLSKYNPREIFVVEAQAFNEMMIPIGLKAKHAVINFDEYCRQIDKGFPVVLGGNFKRTSRVGAHVVCGIGYHDNKIVVNDPYGNALKGYPERGSIAMYERDGLQVEYPLTYFKNGKKMNVIWVEAA